MIMPAMELCGILQKPTKKAERVLFAELYRDGRLVLYAKHDAIDRWLKARSMEPTSVKASSNVREGRNRSSSLGFYFGG